MRGGREGGGARGATGREQQEGRRGEAGEKGCVEHLILLVGSRLVGKQCLDNSARARLGGLVQCTGPLVICSVHISTMLQQSFQQRHQLSCRLACNSNSCKGDINDQHHDVFGML